jgi:hypothetical protein
MTLKNTTGSTSAALQDSFRPANGIMHTEHELSLIMVEQRRRAAGLPPRVGEAMRSQEDTPADTGSDVNTRESVLSEALSAVNHDRNVDYGDPAADFARTARYWNEHLCAVLTRKGKTADPQLIEDMMDFMVDLIGPEDVAIFMTLLKVSRLSWSPEKRDHWVDIAGYAACGADTMKESLR